MSFAALPAPWPHAGARGTESSPSEAAETSAEGQSQEAGENTDGEIAEGTGEAADSSSPFSDDEMFTDRDYETDYDDVAAEISLDETGASCQGDGVEISGQAITITEEGTYLFSGALEDGYIIVDAPDTAKVHLVLNGVSISSGDFCSYLCFTGGEGVPNIGGGDGKHFV